MLVPIKKKNYYTEYAYTHNSCSELQPMFIAVFTPYTT